MDVRGSLVEQFEEYGINLSAPILDKCLDICLQYGVDAQEFVESWMAFSVSNNQEISLDAVGQMERKVFAKQVKREIPTPKGPTKQNGKSSVVVYNASKEHIMYPFLEFNGLSIDNVHPGAPVVEHIVS